MATDRFKQKLQCPKCKREGIAELKQEDGWAFVKGATETDVTYMPDGFHAVNEGKKDGFDILCTDCGLSARVG